MTQEVVIRIIVSPDGGARVGDVDYRQLPEEAPSAELPMTAPQTPVCPDHRKPMNYRPAGTSQRTGRDYGAFWSCPERDCKRKQDAA